MKKYNDSTKCYKIDIFVNKVYVCSTDQSKSCKQAKDRYLLKNDLLTSKDVKCVYYHY